MAEFKIDRLRYTWRGNWINGIIYYKDDVVANIGSSWVCIKQHTSGIFNDDLTNQQPAWIKMTEGIVWKGDWGQNIPYDVNDIVKYGAIVYRCLERHTSGNLLENDQSKWLVYVEGLSFRGNYQPNTRYTAGDLVVYNGSLLSSNLGQTTGTVFNENNWTLEIPGSKVQGTWNAQTLYGVGSVVRHGGWLYYSLTNNINSTPTLSIYPGEKTFPDWTLLSRGIRFAGTWSRFGDYLTGDVVRRGGELYVALLDTNITDIDGSTLDYLDESNWEKINIGHFWREAWTVGTEYRVGDVVRYTGGAYRCNQAHISSDENFPGDNGSGFFFWDLLLASDEFAGLVAPGDLLTFGLSRTLAGDFSTFGPTNLPIGNDGDLLFVDTDDELIYRPYGEIPRFRYVSSDGIDSPDRGSTIASPWRTIRYACERVNDNFGGNTLISVNGGIYEEILPIILPARTSIRGKEIRTTRVRPNKPRTELSGDRIFTITALTRISTLLPNILTGILVTKTISNPLEQTVSAGVSNQATAVQIQNLIANIQTAINFYLQATGALPPLTGSNDSVSTENINNAINLLNQNKEFIAEEAYHFTQTTFPAADIDRDFYLDNFRRFVDAWIYDIRSPGNYRSLLEARYYRNAILGSNNEDMFYLRDTTGIKFLIMEGFKGELDKTQDFYVPNGGIYTSLDPGWGPNDRNTWIIDRSPYVRSITLSGESCIGFKVDGNLHNGGNRTLIYNDYTCVLSDGIGCWVANGGRAEIVSVFTYYCNVGYYATNGGIIRSLTGNCSYGNFGIVADGIDSSEQVQLATVNNRTRQAQVGSIFSGENGQNLIVEWTNAGQEYTDASLSLLGSGVQASTVLEDFRDNAIFECRLLDTNLENEFVQVIGGRGYVSVTANASANPVPGGDEFSIRISDSDVNSESTYLGMRLIIVSGAGVGQYGYISAYNTNNRVVSINKESTGQPGWDHLVPGTPLAPLFNTSTRYVIEPRPVFPDPPFIATEHNIPKPAAEPFNSDWISVVYGETTQTFANIEASGGIIPARFNIVKTRRNYTSVTRVSGGEGYSVGQEIIITGNLLGGYTPENDLTIRVRNVTGLNGTITATGFTFSGQAGSGRFVATTSFGNNTAHSINGQDWIEGSLPAQPGNVKGTWKALAYGNGVFVALRRGTNRAASSTDAINWVNRTLPAVRNWESVVYGNGRFVAVSGNSNSAAVSTNGTTWTLATMPVVGDSSTNEWIDITYGKGLFVAIANSQNVIGYSSDGFNWTGNTELSDTLDSTQRDWISIAYGNNRFVALSSTGDVAYSFDAITWSASSIPTQDGSTPHFWRQIRYAQGVFFAVGDTGGREIGGDSTIPDSNFAATSADGINWTGRALATAAEWRAIGFGNPYTPAEDSSVGKNTPMWVAVAKESGKINRIRTGARAIARAITGRTVINAIRIWDPGSGYIEGPDVTIINPQQSSSFVPVGVEVRDADGVLANPSWINRGFGYASLSTRGTILGNGFADIKQIGRNLIVDGLTRLPKLGSQIVVENSTRQLQVSTATIIGSSNNGLTIDIGLNQDIRTREDYEHSRLVSIREKFSQIRMTGHDFLDIGTGNFEETNYPELYAILAPVPNLPEQESRQLNGGRCFFTATDQAGNFNVGTLFGVEQATGVVDVNADFFDFGGLSELQIGGIRVGQAPVVIREFSTDVAFTENSNTVIPTQKAIAAYLADRLSLGGQALAVPLFTAGQIRVGPEEIINTNNLTIRFPVLVNFRGDRAVVRGSILAQSYFTSSDVGPLG